MNEIIVFNLQDILREYGVESYIDLFIENKIDLDIIGQITDDDLKVMKIPLGDRKRILKLAGDYAEGSGTDHKIDHETPLSKVTLKNQNPAAEAEIRQITVLFADLVGSTPLSETLEIEDYHAALAQFLECCTDIVKDQGGFPARYIGDAILACFGFPKAAEDDAVRAAHAGLRIVEDVPLIQTRSEHPLRARVGIATGLAMTGDLVNGGSESFGPASGAILNLASRLQTLAKPDEVLAEGETRILLGSRFMYHDCRHLQLKGFSESTTIWRLSAARHEEPSLPNNLGQLITPLIGRKEQLQTLQRRWLDSSSKGQVCLVTGEAGIGKSRLLNEFLNRLDLPSKKSIRMQCSANETLRPFHPLIAGVKSLSGLRKEDSEIKQFEQLSSWISNDLRLSPRTTDIVAEVLSLQKKKHSELTELAHRDRKMAIFETLLQLIERLGVNAPFLVVFEDIHWIDPTTAEFLDFLTSQVTPLQAMIVCTYRPDYRPNFIGEPNVSLITLSRLDHEQAAQLMAEVLDGTQLPPHLLEEILARTDGVPLFLEELTKSVLESEFQSRKNTQRSEASLVTLPPNLPTTLLGSLLARLDLIPNIQKIAPIGAAIGRTFRSDLVVRVSGLDNNSASAILTDLTSSGLLVRRGTGTETTYTFKHALVQDAAYETLPKSRRIRIHRQIGDTLEMLGSEFEEVRPEILARHFFLAEEYEKAYSCWLSAARAAESSATNLEAVAYIKAALDANERTAPGPSNCDREIELRELACRPLEITSWGSPEIASNLERLRNLREERGDGDKLVDVLHGLSGYHLIAGQVSKARNVASELLERFGKDDNLAELLGTRLIAFCSFMSADFRDATSMFRKTIDLTRNVDLEEVRRYYEADSALISQCMICWILALQSTQPDLNSEINLAKSMIERAQHRWDNVFSLTILASAYQSAGDAKQCLTTVSAAMPIAEERHSDYWIGWIQCLRGWAIATLGQPTQGIEEIQAGILRYESTGSMQSIPYIKLLLAEANLIANRNDAAKDLLLELKHRRQPREIRYIDNQLARLEKQFHL